MKPSMYTQPVKYIIEDSKDIPRQLERLNALRDLAFAMLKVLDHYINVEERERSRYNNSI